MAGKHEPSRRSFLKVGAITAGTAAPSAKSHARVMGGNERPHAGIIRCGGIGTGHLGGLFALVEEDNTAVKRVCDVFGKRAADFSDQIKEAGGDASPTGDYRDVLDDPDVDYVLIATPEH